MHLNDFNLRIHGETLLICDLYKKLKLFVRSYHYSRVSKQEVALLIFPDVTNVYKVEDAAPFPNVLLKTSF